MAELNLSWLPPVHTESRVKAVGPGHNVTWLQEWSYFSCIPFADLTMMWGLGLVQQFQPCSLITNNENIFLPERLRGELKED